MMENKITVQKLKNNVKSDIALAEKYYSIISLLNNLNLSERDIQLVAYTAVKGNITYGNVRQEFVESYGSSIATIGNIVCKLRKISVLVKEKGFVSVNPAIALDFSKPLTMQISFEHE